MQRSDLTVYEHFSPQMLCLFRSFILFPAHAGVIL